MITFVRRHLRKLGQACILAGVTGLSWSASACELTTSSWAEAHLSVRTITVEGMEKRLELIREGVSVVAQLQDDAQRQIAIQQVFKRLKCSSVQFHNFGARHTEKINIWFDEHQTKKTLRQALDDRFEHASSQLGQAQKQE